ncbi:MAG: DUF2846 domain-containing protein, partial [Rhodocyclaceae bacterium]|nr:DUF2846 domain-containing protein [Rhodocyclaceae bacterium]
MKRLTYAFSLVIVTALMGCASVNTAPPAMQAEAKTFPVQTDKANLYIYRNESFGGAVTMKVSVNDMPIGKTGPKSFFWLKVKPGTYNISSEAENTSLVTVVAEGGKDYFVWQEVKLGLLFARNNLQTVDAATGKAGVLDSQLIYVDPSVVIKPINPPPDVSTSISLTGNSKQKLEELKGLRQEGLITEKDYQDKRKALLK